jgi:hypothetical protein
VESLGFEGLNLRVDKCHGVTLRMVLKKC